MLVCLALLSALSVAVAATELTFQLEGGQAVLDEAYGAHLAPLQMVEAPDMGVPDAYIVQLKDAAAGKEVAGEAAASSLRTTALIKHRTWLLDTIRAISVAEAGTALINSHISKVYNFGQFQGYAGTFSAGVLAAIRANGDVAQVEQDAVVHAEGFADNRYKSMSTVKQTNATWALQRVSHVGSLPSGSDATWLNYTYEYPEHADGAGVPVYIIDTGINIKHPEFGGRAVWGMSVVPGWGETDGYGHGTHVAGTVGSTSFGVAKQATLIAVKVFSDWGYGQVSWIVDAVQYAAQRHRNSRYNRRSVVNMSLGAGLSPAVVAAVDSAVDMGMVVVVSAGNSDKSACSQSPANSAKAITVAASTIEDRRAKFSNFGRCVDIFAPGMDIVSTEGRSTSIKSGTSMASPHVTGIVAGLVASMPAASTVDDIKAALYRSAEVDAIADGKTSPNRFVRIVSA